MNVRKDLADHLQEMDDIASEFKCGISNLIYIIEAADSRDTDKTILEAFNACVFYLDGIQKRLDHTVSNLYEIEREEALA